jgi:MFS family permease
MAGLRGNVAMVTSGVQYAVFIIFTGIMFLFIDKTGRRTLLVYGALGMGLCHLVVGGVMGRHHDYVPGGVGEPPNANIVISVHPGHPANTVILFSYLLIVVYALTLAPVCWIYAAEVWSLGTRATGMSLAALSNWVFNFALGMFTPPAFVNITWKLFIIFGVLCITAAAWFWVFYPETCGKTLEEVELMFSNDGPRPWKTKKGESRLQAGIDAVKARQEGKLGEDSDTPAPAASESENTEAV